MKNVPRYECEQSIQGGKPIANFKLSKTGGWVHFSDIKEFLPTATQQANYKIAITLLKRSYIRRYGESLFYHVFAKRY